jgi:hypothetical protein
MLDVARNTGPNMIATYWQHGRNMCRLGVVPGGGGRRPADVWMLHATCSQWLATWPLNIFFDVVKVYFECCEDSFLCCEHIFGCCEASDGNVHVERPGAR